MRVIIRDNIGLWVALALAVGLKVAILAMVVMPFNADEAVVALMARHILQGERPVFFYGQAYLGSLDAWLIAGAFLILGETVLAVRIVQAALYLGTITTTYALGLKIFNSRWVAAVAACLLAVPTVTVTLYTTATLGGYGEALLIGNVLLLWALRLRESDRPHFEWLLFGALAGFGFWAFGFLGVYLAPIGLALLFRHRDRSGAIKKVLSMFSVRSVAYYSLAFLGFAFGSSPWWGASLFGAATISELGGSAIAGASAGGPVVEALRHAFYFVVLGLPVIIGLRPSWAVRWLALPLFPLAFVMFVGAVSRAVKLSIGDGKRALLLGVCLTLVIAFVVTPFGADPSGRYFLPLVTPLALFTVDLLDRLRRDHSRVALVLLIGLLGFNLWGHVDAATAFPPGFTTQFDPVAQVDQRDLPKVIDFLLAHGETRGYSNYWVTFPAAFLSHERIIFSAALPYHLDFRYTPRDDRYPPYARAVADSDHAAYVTTKHPSLDDRLRARFAALGVTFDETQIGDFHVFYGLSRKVLPEEVGLGVNCCP